jgi:hypothetical protein
MKHQSHFQRTALMTVLCAAVIVSGALAAGPPTVTVALTPATAAPGAAVTAKATVKINDGSTLQTITWKQTGGPTVTFTGGTTDTISTTFPDRKAFRTNLTTVLEEPPVDAAVLPANVPLPATWENGLQDRFGVVGISNHALAEAAALTFDLTILTSSGTYHVPATISASLPWTTSTGQRNVPIKLPVIVHGKKQATYNWALTAPTGSAATLVDATMQDPEFTPDVPGTYKLTVTDLAKNSTVTINVVGGKWKGIITGQDANGRPTVDASCKTCHVGAVELFTPWSLSGHAEILTQNVNDPATTNHYSTACLECHSVGYSATALGNGGVTDAADWAKAAALIPPPGNSLKWTKILSDAPAAARLMNIQCENCHGPQDSTAHTQVAPRVSLSSDVCGSCHGEPTRHGRFQQWQLSGHANYETAGAEGTNTTCGKCHSAQGFMQWQGNNFSTANLNVTWTTDEVHPVTCAVCHDPHAEGTTSGDATTNATVRVTGTTPLLMAGFTATNVGRGAICMTCHNGRRGLKDDQHTMATLSQAPHAGPQADVLMGQNMYFAKVGTRSFHSMIPDSCVTCHMESTPPPATLSNNLGGTNHTFYASNTICSKCHSSITADSIQGPVTTKMANLKSGIEAALKGTMQAQIRAGNDIDLGGQKTVKDANDITGVEFIESHGAQGVTVTLAGGTKVADLSLATVKVVRPAGSPVELLAVADPAIAKAGWNYWMVSSDKSKGVHNPLFVNSALDIALFATTAYNATIAAPAAVGGGNASLGGGLGNGAGAVSCTTKYVYWAELVGHAPGNGGSQWRTDIIARNLGSNDATLKFYLHQADGSNLQGGGTVVANGQKAFEDIVANAMNVGNNLGALEICSDQPLLVAGRNFNQVSNGTFGQNLDGRVADLGYSAGQTVNLIGLRQSDIYRSNISVTNGGTTEAQVSISLFDATGLPIKTYTVTIPAGTVVQDNEPYKNRANTPGIDWGYATVTVLKGTNVLTSGSMIDSRTNDPSTITAKQ